MQWPLKLHSKGFAIILRDTKIDISQLSPLTCPSNMTHNGTPSGCQVVLKTHKRLT